MTREKSDDEAAGLETAEVANGVDVGGSSRVERHMEEGEEERGVWLRRAVDWAFMTGCASRGGERVEVAPGAEELEGVWYWVKSVNCERKT